MYEEGPSKWVQNWISLKEGRLYLFSSRTVWTLHHLHLQIITTLFCCLQDAWPHGVIELEGCAVEVESKPEEKKKKKATQFVFLIANPQVGSTRFGGMNSTCF